MADEADLAFDSEQRHLRQALDAHRLYTGGLRATGHCHHCGSATAGALLFCDRDCADDWEYQDALRRKLGLTPENMRLATVSPSGRHMP